MRVITKTQTVVEQVEVTKPLPETLTNPLPYPPALPDQFTVDDVFDLVFALFDSLDTANADRAKSKELTQPQADADIPQ